MSLIFIISSSLFLALAADISVLRLVIILVEGRQKPDHRFKQQQNVVETVDLEFFIKGSPHVFLIGELLQERTLLIDSLQIFDHTDLFARVDFLVVLKQFGHNLFKHALSCSIVRLRHERVVLVILSLFFLVRLVFVQWLIVKNLVENFELVLLLDGAISLIFSCVDPNGRLQSGCNVLSLSQKVQRKLVFQKQEEVHIDVQLLKTLLVTVSQAA